VFVGLLFATFAGWLTHPPSVIVRTAIAMAALGKILMQGYFAPVQFNSFGFAKRAGVARELRLQQAFLSPGHCI
jgi:hypothetical protein